MNIERAYQRILFGVASLNCGEINLIAEKREYAMGISDLIANIARTKRLRTCPDARERAGPVFPPPCGGGGNTGPARSRASGQAPNKILRYAI